MPACENCGKEIDPDKQRYYYVRMKGPEKVYENGEVTVCHSCYTRARKKGQLMPFASGRRYYEPSMSNVHPGRRS